MNNLESLIDEIEKARSPECFQRVFALVQSRLGYRYCCFLMRSAYAAHPEIRGGVSTNIIASGDVPAEVRTWLEDDTAVRKFCSSGFKPALLGEVMNEGSSASSRGDDAAAMDSVVVVPFGQRHECGCIVLGLTPSQRPTREMAEKVGWYWMILAGYLREAYRRCTADTEIGLKLTARERECLTWAAQGKTSWEIGQILGVAERTVIFHLNNCLRKTDSSRRQQAVTKCLQNGLITV